jgi:hypothetical protein
MLKMNKYEHNIILYYTDNKNFINIFFILLNVWLQICIITYVIIMEQVLQELFF